MAVGQRLQRAAALAVRTGEAVVVHQRVEPVEAAVPDVPDEGALVEKLAVLLEETVAQPRLDGLGGPAAPRRGAQELSFQRWRPVGAVRYAASSRRSRSAAAGSPLTDDRQTMPSASANAARSLQQSTHARASSAKRMSGSCSAGQR